MTKAYFYGRALLRLGGYNLGTGGPFDFDADTFKCALVKASYGLSELKLDTDEFLNDGSADGVAAHEISSGLGYERAQIALPQWDYLDDVSATPGNIARFSDGAGVPTIFSTFTGTFRYAVLYKEVLSPGDPPDSKSPVVMVVDFETEITVTDGNFVVSWAPEGIFRIKALQDGSLPITESEGASFPFIFPLSFGD